MELLEHICLLLSATRTLVSQQHKFARIYFTGLFFTCSPNQTFLLQILQEFLAVCCAVLVVGGGGKNIKDARGALK
jgi:hypothetical protein